MEPPPSQSDHVDTKFKRHELVSRPREPTPPAGGQRGWWGSQRSAGGGPTGAPLTPAGQGGAVRLVGEIGKPIAQVARDLGINAGTLGN